MRNLKRVLALALAVIMMIGMMVTASAATYADEATIDAKYADAVEVTSDMGVFRGQGTGFAPKATLTRAEAAAILYRVMNSDVTDAKVSLYDYESTKLADIEAGKWYTGYINFANNGGYVMGDGTNFYPLQTVTGTQFLAMMLRALGYGQKGEYEGGAWIDNVLTDASEKGLLAGIANVASLNSPATREVVAQLLWNALRTNMTTYTPALGYVTSLLTTPDTLGKVKLGLTAGAASSDAFGRPAAVWTYNYNALTKKSSTTLPATPVKTYNTAIKGCDLLKDLGYAEGNNTVVTFNTFTNGKAAGHTATVSSCHNSITFCAAKNHVYGAQGQVMEVYKTTTANVYTVVYVDTYLAKIGVTAKANTAHDLYDTVALTVYETEGTTGVAKTFSFLTGTKAYTKDAYALVTMADGVVKSAAEIAPAATAKGTYWLNTAAGQTTIVGGVTYNDANKFFVGQNTWDATKTWNVYTDTFGNIIGLIEYVAPNTYVYGVISALKWVDTNDLLNSGYVLSNLVEMNAQPKASVILKANALVTGSPDYFHSSGAAAGVYANETVSESTQYNGAYLDTLFQYTLNADGSYNITNKAGVVTGKQSIKTGVANLWTDGTNAMATNDNTVYLVKTGTAAAPVYTTYTGYKTVPSMNNVDVQFLKAATAAGVYTDYVFVNAIGATYDGNKGFVWFTKDLEATDAIGVNATGDKAYLAYIDGVATPVYLDAATEAATLTAINAWDLYQVTRNADGDITGAVRFSSVSGYKAITTVTGITGTVITNGTTAGTVNCTGAAVYTYAADGSSVTPVAEADWATKVVGKTAYCMVGADGIVDFIYVVA